MPKQYSIKWREADIEKVRKAIKNFNAKIDYWRKKHPETAEFLPEKISEKSLKREIKTREDFNKRIKELQDFSKKGSTKIVTVPDSDLKVTAWELNIAKKRLRKINEMRKKEADLAESRSVERNGSQYQTAKLKAAKQRSIPEELPKERETWKSFLKRIRQSRWRSETGMLNVYKDRIEIAITAEKAGYTPEQQRYLFNLIKKLGYIKCMELFYSGEEALDPDWIYYDPTDNDVKVKIIERIILKELGNADLIIEAVRRSNMSSGQKEDIIAKIKRNPQQVLNDYLDNAEMSVFDPDYIQSDQISGDIKYQQLLQALE